MARPNQYPVLAEWVNGDHKVFDSVQECAEYFNVDRFRIYQRISSGKMIMGLRLRKIEKEEKILYDSLKLDSTD